MVLGAIARRAVLTLQALGIIGDDIMVINREEQQEQAHRQEQARRLARAAEAERARRDDQFTFKVEKRKVENFSGKNEDWNRWKLKAKSIFRGAGLGNIISDRAYATAHPNKNRVVYSELIAATVDGHARHYVEDFDNDEDGHGAWMALVEHFDRTHIQAPMAEELKVELRALRLHSGTTASAYVNLFKTKKLALDRITAEKMSEYEYKNTLIKGVVDPEYNHVKQDLRGALANDGLTLEEMIHALIDRERQIVADKKSQPYYKKRPRRLVDTTDDEEDDLVQMKKKIRKLQQELDKKSGDTSSSSKGVELNLGSRGRISVPSDTWISLDKSTRDFVVRYNRAAQHNDPRPTIPPDVVLLEQGERVRRTCGCTETPTSNPEEPSPNTDANDEPTPKTETTSSDSAKSKGITFGIGRKYRLPSVATPSIMVDSSPFLEDNLLIFDTGGGRTPTITSQAWHILANTGVTSAFQGYGPGTPVTQCEVVHAMTKAHIKGRSEPVMLVIHHASLLKDEEEPESLLTLMDLLRNSVDVNGVTPPEYVKSGSNERTCGITVNNEYLPFSYDEEKLFFHISKPTLEEVEDESIPVFELNSRDPVQTGIKPNSPVATRRTQKTYQWEQIPMEEWEKRLGFPPTEVINRTLASTTQHYIEIEAENRTDPRRHFSKRFRGLQYDRRNEEDATDTIFPSMTSSQGHTCSQFFTGVQSKRWFVVPMKKEQHNHRALQDHLRINGSPRILRSDNARSETGAEWTQICRDYKIEQKSSEPHKPNQNPAEAEIGRFSRMVRRNMKAFNVPLGLHNWCQIYCTQINNVTARRSLNWRTPTEVSTGYTPDISAFRFHFYEPLWYFKPSVKSPEDNMAKARYLCQAESSGDALTYYILTEPYEGRPQVLIRSVIRSRRKKVGTTAEHTNEQPEYENFFFSDDEGRKIVDESLWDDDDTTVTLPPHSRGDVIEHDEDRDNDDRKEGAIGDNTDPGEQHQTDPAELLPPETNAGNDIDEETEGDMMRLNEQEESFEFEKIVDHRFDQMALIFKVRYRTPADRKLLMDIPWEILKNDQPESAARYIRLYVKESTRKGQLKVWADQILKREKIVMRRLRRLMMKEETKTMKKEKGKKKSRNTRWTEKVNKEMYGYRVPNTVIEALEFDKQNGNDYWKKAIDKEMKGLFSLDVFKFVDADTTFDKTKGWQRAPLRMIFTVKAEMEDGHHRHKARFVVGGHRLDSTGYNIYSSTVKSLSVRLLLVIAAHLGLSTMTADVANAFCTAPNQEQVWAECGPEFGERSGQKVIIQRALYGMATASRSFHDFLGDMLSQLGFVPSRADPDVWIIQSKDHDGYDYVATWVDDLICIAKKPEQYMHMIEQQFKLRNMEHSPKYYLGMDLKRRNDGLLQASTETYVKEALRKHEAKHGQIPKFNTPMAADCHPELDESKILNEDQHRLYQQIIGVCQWVSTTGRFDISYAVSSLSRFASEPRESHLTMATRILGYLKKYPSKGFIVNPSNPIYNNNEYTVEEFKEDFGLQYQYFKEQIDERFPTPKIKGLDITFFSDSDHGHDKKTGRSITGLIGFVGSTPVVARSTRQTCVQTSTFGAELTALKTTTEEVLEVRYYLRSLGVEVNAPTKIFVDNEGVVLNTTNPSSSLNKKALALAYHFVREHQHGGTIQVRKIGTDDNYSDPMTKPLTSDKHHGFFYELMAN